ncbi:unnamed protein product [Rhizophagus irregularis]|nr:unnamed protein product [Rhizophagus irregularis]
MCDKVSKLEEHLANHCSEALGPIVRKYLEKILECEDKANKKRKHENNQMIMTDFHDSTKIPDVRITRINRALTKFFVACELNAEYEPPIREYLSDQLLERELAMISPTHCSNWNFIIMTPSRKEYLFKLADLSENSHTGNFLSEIIGEVIEKIGANKYQQLYRTMLQISAVHVKLFKTNTLTLKMLDASHRIPDISKISHN